MKELPVMKPYIGGEWIDSGYIKTADGNHICDECYTRHDIEED